MDLAKPRLGAGRAGPHHGNELSADTAPELERLDHSARTGRCANEKALLMPAAIPGNPYQRQLTGTLDRLGTEVACANPAGALPDHAPIGILRLHWMHRLALADDRLRSVVKAVRFIMERAL